MLSRGKLLVAFLIGCSFIGYQFVLHEFLTSNQLTSSSAVLLLTPFAIAVCLVIATEFGMLVAVIIAASMALAGLSLPYIFGLPSPAFLLGLPHLTANAFLAWLFARTLAKDRIPLVTALALRVHGTLSEAKRVYTRRVTLAWSLFFLLQALVSLGLYAFATLDTWSTYINVLNAPLVIAMFVGEFLLRMLVFRDHRHSPLAGIQAYLHNSPKSTKIP